MDKIKSHLCLVSGQPIPNITPLLDKSFAPENVILLISPGMQQKAEWLERFIKPRGIKVIHWLIDDAWDIEHIQDKVMDLLVSEYGEGLALNATGGTKPMSIGAYSVFDDNPVFYVHPDEDKILWMNDTNKKAQAIEDNLKLPDFLMVYGYDFMSGDQNNSTQESLELAQALIKNIENFSKPLGQINYLANRAEGNSKLQSPEVDRYNQTKDFLALIQLFEDKGVCYFDNDRLTFNSEEKRFFANGGWLEEYVFSVMRNISKSKERDIKDLYKSVEVKSFNGITKNELDIAFLSNNHFYVIECKTKNWKEKGSGSDAIYKLDTLKETLGGLQGKGMLVTYRKLSKSDQARAKSEGIKVCQFTELKRLDEFLKQWIQG